MPRTFNMRQSVKYVTNTTIHEEPPKLDTEQEEEEEVGLYLLLLDAHVLDGLSSSVG